MQAEWTKVLGCEIPTSLTPFWPGDQPPANLLYADGMLRDWLDKRDMFATFEALVDAIFAMPGGEGWLPIMSCLVNAGAYGEMIPL